MSPTQIALTFGLIKGALIASVTAAMGFTFVQSLIVAIVSGSLGIFGMICAAIITTRAARQNREVLHDIKRKVGAANRREDQEDL